MTGEVRHWGRNQPGKGENTIFSASSRTDIATKPTATDPFLSCKQSPAGPADSMLAGKRVDVLLARLSITPGLHPATSWGPLGISNWH